MKPKASPKSLLKGYLSGAIDQYYTVPRLKKTKRLGLIMSSVVSFKFYAG